MHRVLLSTILACGFAALLLAGLAGSVQSAPARPTNVAPEVWEATAAGRPTEFLVVLTAQADLGAAARLPTREKRLQAVYEVLREAALRTQAGLRAELDRVGVSYRAFYIVNMLVVRGDRALVARLSARADVARIVANPSVRLSENSSIDPRGRRAQGPRLLAGVEWNVARVNADDVWAQGFTGQGIVVAGQDTGYDWQHPALVRQYRGNNGVTVTHDYSWHDAIHTNTHAYNECGVDSPAPCDDDGHGTHTMGTLVGDGGAGNQIGVAPGASWIGCRNMDNGWGTPATYAECFEFFLAPYPLGGDPFTDGVPSLAPHVINNSWTCPGVEGCDWATLQQIVESVRVAGIVVVASAGNAGSACETVTEPPALYDAAFSVGASTSSDVIASFSSRGPVMVDGSGRRKPDVVAPGVGVRSSIPGGGYASMQGTSMAGPHVAGIVALLWSAAPSLVGDVDATERLIERTARPFTTTLGCGGDGPDAVPNNVYGWGIVDALAMVRAAQGGLEIAKQADFSAGVPAPLLVYTITVTNTSYATLTQIVLTDTVPANTTFAWASGDYLQADGIVTWTAASLASRTALTATLAVTVEHLPEGTRLVNAAYGVHAAEALTAVMGAPVEAAIPWRMLLFPVSKNWLPDGN